jgi:hemerythrin-like domain-containing protein
MAVQLGAKPAANGAVDLLLECHQRIRSFVSLAKRLARAGDLGPEEIAEAAGSVRRYFQEALPLHAADEEESVAPLLAGRDPALDGALAVMRREHGEHAGVVGRVAALCAELARTPARHAALAPLLGAAAAELERHFAFHLALEEETLFPALKRVLDAAADARLAAEMRARRRKQP